MKVTFTPSARADLFEALEWYNEQKAGLGASLDLEFETTMQRIAENPKLYPAGRKQIRKAPVHRFPYTIIYRIQADTIAVYACYHDRRDPRRWRSRV